MSNRSEVAHERMCDLILEVADHDVELAQRMIAAFKEFTGVIHDERLQELKDMSAWMSDALDKTFASLGAPKS